ncbi:TolC family protein [Flavobacterium arcticum]|uniref:TolC family protein n=1 Tax=Flavobacterium arcticum TaxID=1784713 RepID=A0A345HA99_9FLAO|nr:TolC family protein [Flavobacterium arcticum]AXG73509.1 TolC family protein [Flavobacterium arcticum]KAF2513299.1 TolC family protein [Flavobacterium arcticum]
MKKNQNQLTSHLFKALSLLLVYLFAPQLRAQEATNSYSYSLEEAVQHALQYNYSVINSGRDVQASVKKKWETIASGLPQISASGNYQNNFAIQQSVIPAELFGGNPGEFTAVAFSTKHSATASATLEQLIFDGSYIVGVKAAKTYLDFYETSKKKTDIEIKEQVINAYGNVLLTQENIAILEKNKATLEKNKFEINENFKSGFSEEEDVEQISITLATVNSSLNNAKRLEKITINMLKLVLGIDLEDKLNVTDKLEDLTMANLDVAFTGSDFNVQSNIDYKLSANNQEQKRLLLQQEKSKALPTLSTSLAFGYNGYNDKFKFTNKDQMWLDYSYLSVNLSVPIFSSFARSARTQQAKIALEQAQTQLTETEQNLKLQYQQAESEYEYSVEEYTTSKNNMRLAERIENKQQIKFREGLSSSFELSEAQRQLYSAQQSYLQAMLNVINTKATLQKLTAQ